MSHKLGGTSKTGLPHALCAKAVGGALVAVSALRRVEGRVDNATWYKIRLHVKQREDSLYSPNWRAGEPALTPTAQWQREAGAELCGLRSF